MTNLRECSFSSQFSNCSLVRMLDNRTLNNEINRLHERCIHIVCNDNWPSFKELPLSFMESRFDASGLSSGT